MIADLIFNTNETSPVVGELWMNKRNTTYQVKVLFNREAFGPSPGSAGLTVHSDWGEDPELACARVDALVYNLLENQVVSARVRAEAEYVLDELRRTTRTVRSFVQDLGGGIKA